MFHLGRWLTRELLLWDTDLGFVIERGTLLLKKIFLDFVVRLLSENMAKIRDQRNSKPNLLYCTWSNYDEIYQMIKYNGTNFARQLSWLGSLCGGRTVETNKKILLHDPHRSHSGGGVPPILCWGHPLFCQGYPLSCLGGSLGQDLRQDWAYPPAWTWTGVPYPPYPWHCGQCCNALWEAPREQTHTCENITFPHPSECGREI